MVLKRGFTVYWNHPVQTSIHISCNQSDELILMKLCTVVVVNLRMCIKEDNSCPKNIKGDNSRKIICGGPWVSFEVLTHSSSVRLV